jgi:hypothetical protein
MIAFEEMLADDEALAQLAHTNAVTRAAIEKAVADAADLGVTTAIEEVGTVGFDYTLVNEAAMAFAQNHSAQLIKGIDQTTATGVRASVANWVESGDELESLISDLERYYSRERAELIALTETTGSFGSGNYIVYQQSGVAKGTIWNTVGADEHICDVCRPLDQQKRLFGEEFAPGIYFPAAHPRCRCAISAWLEGDD